MQSREAWPLPNLLAPNPEYSIIVLGVENLYQRGSNMRDVGNRPIAIFLSLLLVATLGLVGCGGAAGNASSTSTGADSQSASSESAAAATGELVGKPWVSCMLQDNLPAQAPEAKDDLYTHYAYDWLKEHQEQPVANMMAHASEFPTAIAGIIDDKSKSSPELDQMRIFYNQALDAEALKKAGLSEVQPYLDRIDAVKSIDELNALLLADDFPFSPFILANLATYDLRQSMCVAIYPNLLFSDPYLQGGTFYQDADTPEMQQAMQNGLLMQGQYTMLDFMALGMSKDEVNAKITPLMDFEKTYAKHADYAGKYLKSEFGAAAKSTREGALTPDAAFALSPNFPLKETLAKLKKDNSSLYLVQPDCLKAFNDCWTNENLESLKLIAKAKILQETRPYRDPSGVNAQLEALGNPVPDSATFAYNACNNLDTLAQVVAKTYVSDVLGADAKTRMESMTNNLLSEYRELINKTTWVSDESKANLLEKVDNMTLNILEPEGGYLDYSGLRLKTTEEGGTLMSNYLTLKQYRIDRESEIVGQPARAVSSWFSVGPTVMNAFYDSSNNSINILPGYISSLIYTADMSDTDLLASLGFTIAHEICHGFDFLGTQANAYGEATPVFTDKDIEAFTQRTTKFADYLSTIEPLPGVKCDGQNLIAEAGADLSGMQITMLLAKNTKDFDYNQFYTKLGNVWAQVADQNTFVTLLADTHPLNNLRMNVCSQMCDEMYEALGVKEGDGMYLAPEQRILFWGEKA